MPSPDFLAANSLYIENTLRYAFLFALARHLLLLEPPEKLAILNAEVDDSGVDLVLALGGTRHVQMKTRNRSHASNAYAIAESLFDLPGGLRGVDELRRGHDGADRLPLPGTSGNGVMGDAHEYPPSFRKKDGINVSRPGYRDVKSRRATYKDLSIGKLAEALFEATA